MNDDDPARADIDEIRNPSHDYLNDPAFQSAAFEALVKRIRVGTTYLVREAEGCSKTCFWDGKNWRVLLGADLIRLFTGKDTAVYTGSSTGDQRAAAETK